MLVMRDMYMDKYDSDVGHHLYSFSPLALHRLGLSPSFSNDQQRTSLASVFAECHGDIQRPATHGLGDPPASAAPSPDVVTCQWGECHAAFDDLYMFTFHLYEGAPRLHSLTLPKHPDFPRLCRSHRRGQFHWQLHL